MSVMERQHGIASYNKGHRCADCKEAKKAQGQRLRAARYSTREYIEGAVMCISCCCWFSPHGIDRHERACQG